jgi:hypothetical protein
MHFREMLQIRKSSPLFRLQTAEDIQARLTFQNTGPDQIPGLIVMTIVDIGDLPDIDPNHEMVVALFNASADTVSFTDAGFEGWGGLELHPVLAESQDAVVRNASFDPTTGTFSIPGRTAAVFVLKEA